MSLAAPPDHLHSLSGLGGPPQHAHRPHRSSRRARPNQNRPVLPGKNFHRKFQSSWLPLSFASRISRRLFRRTARAPARWRNDLSRHSRLCEVRASSRKSSRTLPGWRRARISREYLECYSAALGLESLLGGSASSAGLATAVAPALEPPAPPATLPPTSSPGANEARGSQVSAFPSPSVVANGAAPPRNLLPQSRSASPSPSTS